MAGLESRARGGNILITLGLLLIAAALALGALNVLEERRAGEASAQALAQIEGARVRAADAPFAFSPDTPMPVMEAGSNVYVGTLAIPSLGLELPILSEWSYDGLNVAPCRYAGSAYADDLVICGHNYRTHFATLQDVNYGAEVLFTDVLGNAFRYQVASVETLEPAAVQDMVESDYDLTLFTCNFTGTARVTVRCNMTW